MWLPCRGHSFPIRSDAIFTGRCRVSRGLDGAFIVSTGVLTFSMPWRARPNPEVGRFCFELVGTWLFISPLWWRSGFIGQPAKNPRKTPRQPRLARLNRCPFRLTATIGTNPTTLKRRITESESFFVISVNIRQCMPNRKGLVPKKGRNGIARTVTERRSVR